MRALRWWGSVVLIASGAAVVLFGGVFLSVIFSAQDGATAVVALTLTAASFGLGAAVIAGGWRLRPRTVARRGRRAVGVDQADQLLLALEDLRRDAVMWVSRLPDATDALLARLLLTLDVVTSHGARLTRDPVATHIVNRTMTDYLPTTVQTYLALPIDYHRDPDSGRRALEQLLAQLATLVEAVDRVETGLDPRRHDKLDDQSRFLEAKFGSTQADRLVTSAATRTPADAARDQLMDRSRTLIDASPRIEIGLDSRRDT